VSLLSHELRTPLNSIQGHAELLNRYPLPADGRDVLSRIEANVARLTRLANNLSDHALASAGELRLRIAPLAPADLVAYVQDRTEAAARRKGLTLECRVADDVPATLRGDEERLRQILGQLTRNSVSFTEARTMGVRVYCPDADHWAIQVSDTGCGIGADALERVFEAWQIGGDFWTRHIAVGAGLGLAITRHLVRLMGGEISVESQVGRGSTFTVVLPLRPVGDV
jgi:signal transduction histidine kinase